MVPFHDIGGVSRWGENKACTSPEKWLQRVGEHEIANAGDDIIVPDQLRLRYDDGLLFFDYFVSSSYKAAARFVLLPVSDTEATLYGLGRGMGETIRVVTIDDKEGLYYSAYLMQMKKKKR